MEQTNSNPRQNTVSNDLKIMAEIQNLRMQIEFLASQLDEQGRKTEENFALADRYNEPTLSASSNAECNTEKTLEMIETLSKRLNSIEKILQQNNKFNQQLFAVLETLLESQTKSNELMLKMQSQTSDVMQTVADKLTEPKNTKNKDSEDKDMISFIKQDFSQMN